MVAIIVFIGMVTQAIPRVHNVISSKESEVVPAHVVHIGIHLDNEQSLREKVFSLPFNITFSPNQDHVEVPISVVSKAFGTPDSAQCNPVPQKLVRERDRTLEKAVAREPWSNASMATCPTQ